MSTFTSRFIKACLGATLILIVSLGLVPQAIAADDELRHEWILKVETEEMPRQFRYPGSPYAPVAKMTVTYAHATEPDKEMKYENVWYHGGKPLGLEKTGRFGITRGDAVTLQIVHKKDGGDEEYKGIANLILRLTLDAYHNGNPILSIVVPHGSFEDICSELNALNIIELPHPADKAMPGRLLFNMESQPDGLERRLYYK